MPLPLPPEFVAALERITDPADRAAIERMANANYYPAIVHMRAVFMVGADGAFIAPFGFPVNDLVQPLEPGTVWPIIPDPRVQAAYTAGRSARFEYGESG